MLYKKIIVVHLDQRNTIIFEPNESIEWPKDTEEQRNIVYRLQGGVRKHYDGDSIIHKTGKSLIYS